MVFIIYKKKKKKKKKVVLKLLQISCPSYLYPFRYFILTDYKLCKLYNNNNDGFL